MLSFCFETGSCVWAGLKHDRVTAVVPPRASQEVVLTHSHRQWMGLARKDFFLSVTVYIFNILGFCVFYLISNQHNVHKFMHEYCYSNILFTSYSWLARVIIAKDQEATFVSCLVESNLNFQISHQLSSYQYISTWFTCLLSVSAVLCTVGKYPGEGKMRRKGYFNSWSGKHGVRNVRQLVTWGPPSA